MANDTMFAGNQTEKDILGHKVTLSNKKEWIRKHDIDILNEIDDK